MRYANVCRSCGELTWLKVRINTMGNWGGRVFIDECNRCSDNHETTNA